MPFLPLYFQLLGLQDVGEIALWSGLSLGVTPALTAVLSPFWGRLADRYGRKIMVERSLSSFVIVMGAMAYVSQPWHVFALRAAQGLFAGYGALTLTMAADSAPRERMASAIGIIQTAQRLGPAIGPILGGAVAQAVGMRRAFLVTAAFYLVALVLVFWMYDERAVHHELATNRAGRMSFRSVLAFENFILLMAVIFGLQFVDRSFGPVLPLFVTELGTAPGPGAAHGGPAVLDRRGRRRDRSPSVRPSAPALAGPSRHRRQRGRGIARGAGVRRCRQRRAPLCGNTDIRGRDRRRDHGGLYGGRCRHSRVSQGRGLSDCSRPRRSLVWH